MKKQIKSILKGCYKMPLDRNSRFWAGLLDELTLSIRREAGPAFLSSWVKEALDLLKDTKSLNIVLAMPADGSWAVYIDAGVRFEGLRDKRDYMFSCTDGKKNIYFSKRVYEYFEKAGDYRITAAFVLQETVEFILYQKAAKRGRIPNPAKIHGEALRVSNAFCRGGKALDKTLRHFLDIEKERRAVTVDNADIFVEGCAVSGEEIIAELRSFSLSKESFVIELAYGQKKQIKYLKGEFNISARHFALPFSCEGINYNDYLRLMQIMDNFFVEENITESRFAGLLAYIKGMDYQNDSDNVLLGLVWVFTQRFYTGLNWQARTRERRYKFLYNLYLLIDEYIGYFAMLDEIKKEYWSKGKFIKNHLNRIALHAYNKKGFVLETKKENISEMKASAALWFSKSTEIPRFAKAAEWTGLESMPENLSKQLRKGRQEGISAELSMHKDILNIMEKINNLKDEYRKYSRVERYKGSKVCRLLMVRTHFWNKESIFTAGQRAYIYTLDKNTAGFVEVLDVQESSLIISLKDMQSIIPDTGYIKGIVKADESIDAERIALDKAAKSRGLARKVLKIDMPEPEKTLQLRLTFLNPLIAENASQREAVTEAVGGGNKITLIQGPPGTGKTTVIAEIVLQYLKQGRRILLSSQTHNAVDNALECVLRYKQSCHGAGRAASVEEKITNSAIRHIWIKDKNGFDRFQARYNNGMVIGATNVGTHTLGLMKGREFDVLIMDEAGKSNIVESILPVLLLRPEGRLVIVGDHMQGAPFCYPEEVLKLFIEKRGLPYDRRNIVLLSQKVNQSLFERFVKKGCRSIMLKVNYRSELQIVKLVSRLFYKGMLVPAKTAGDRRQKSIVVVDTSRSTSCEERREIAGDSGRGYKNPYEAEIVLKEIKELLKRRGHIRDVTILAPYLSQVDEIRKALSAGLTRFMPRNAVSAFMENITTIDSFQGRENDIVIISFTRSNADPGDVGFLNELNRINIALSRAKKKMILIGDFQTLRNVKKNYNAAGTRRIFKTIYAFR